MKVDVTGFMDGNNSGCVLYAGYCLSGVGWQFPYAELLNIFFSSHLSKNWVQFNSRER